MGGRLSDPRDGTYECGFCRKPLNEDDRNCWSCGCTTVLKKAHCDLGPLACTECAKDSCSAVSFEELACARSEYSDEALLQTLRDALAAGKARDSFTVTARSKTTTAEWAEKRAPRKEPNGEVVQTGGGWTDAGCVVLSPGFGADIKVMK